MSSYIKHLHVMPTLQRGMAGQPVQYKSIPQTMCGFTNLAAISHSGDVLCTSIPAILYMSDIGTTHTLHTFWNCLSLLEIQVYLCVEHKAFVRSWENYFSAACGTRLTVPRCWELRWSDTNKASFQPSYGLDGATLPLLVVLLAELEGDSIQRFSAKTSITNIQYT